MNGAKVWAFEPNPENYRCAAITIAINGLDNVVLRNAGLADQNRKLPMKVIADGGRAMGGASQYVEGAETNSKQFAMTDVVKLDDVLPPERKISVLQLDVEEFEQQALTGAMDTIRKHKPIIVLENVPERKWFAENILSLGYRPSEKLHSNTVFRPL